MLLESRKIPVGMLDRQTGFIASPKGFLIIIGFSLLLLATLLILKTIKTPSIKGKSEAKQSIMTKEVFISMIALVAYVATVRIFGFYINSFILLVVIMIIYYVKEKRMIIRNKRQLMVVVLKVFFISFISLIVLQQLFVRMLGVNLPRGIFGF